MLENPSSDTSSTTNVAIVKRYAPPNQRNRSLDRRKSGGDQLERANSYVNDGGKNTAPKNAPNVNHGDAGNSNRINENSFGRLIPLHGCCNSEAFQLLNDRWAAAMNMFNNLPEDSSGKPIFYSRKSAAPRGYAMLPHLLMQPAANTSTGLQNDFSCELRHAIQNANTSSVI